MAVTRSFKLLLLAAGLTLAACAPTQMNATVTRFHAEQIMRPGSFSVVPDDRQRGSLEFQAYAEQVQARLEELGFRAMPASGAPDYVVVLDYGVGDRRTQMWRQPAMGSFGYGIGSRSSSGIGLGMGLGAPFYDNYYDTQTWTTFPHRLAVNLYDGSAWRNGDRRSVFEGRAISDMSTPQLPRAIPYLSRALFERFPGNSGETVAVSVPLAGK